MKFERKLVGDSHDVSVNNQGKRVADWEFDKPTEWNIFQKIGAGTHGIVTPGNSIDLASVGLVYAGYRAARANKYVLSAALVGSAFYLDRINGKVAKRTKTICPQGEISDVVSDRARIGITAWGFSKLGLLKKAEIAPVATFNFANTALTGIAKARDVEISKEDSNKIGFAGQLIYTGLIIAANMLEDREHEAASNLVRGLSYATLIPTIYYSSKGSIHLTKEAFAPKDLSLTQENIPEIL